ncbi:outer membrane protein [Prosthecomicrobium pneumaticum]|uniref:Outer membrane immunogenic protein n=1 Tax=Prosthecomicrobium pneumaticum TaxID=81895 RepID=A0A7W9CVB3_9HYPH|nr:outer membrane protein [Prosthecomicrobium pneumaticum]MBB5752027.1 outer membrane immunogenic protein [Prosthecomicrobium pneumaticum]
MRTSLLLAGVALAGFVSVAQAADLTGYEPAPAPVLAPAAPAFDWSGLYIGVHGGYAWSDIDYDSLTSGSFDADGLFGGVQAGYNFQNGPFVIGAEFDFSLSDVSGDTFDGGTISTSSDWGATARLRAGYAFDRFLVYGTGGLAVSDASASVEGVGSDDKTLVGWALGAGVEAFVTQKVSLKVEYLHLDYGSETFDFGPFESDNDVSADIVRAGLNFHF